MRLPGLSLVDSVHRLSVQDQTTGSFVTKSVDLLPDRLLEQMEPWTQWDRRAWEPGTLLRLRELSEATAWAQKGVLSEGAVHWLRDSLRPLIGQDAGLGDGAVKSQLELLLKDRLVYGSQQQRQLDQLTTFIDSSYLRRWRDALASGGPIHLERSSRHVASHVIDAGYHPEWLRKRTRKLVIGGATAVDIVDEYLLLLAEPVRQFEGFVALTYVPESNLIERADGWMSGPAVREALQAYPERQRSAIRQVGGLRFDIVARDPRSAAAVVYDRMERLANRTHFVRSDRPLTYHPKWFATDGAVHGLGEGQKQINVLSLVKTGVLYSASLTDERANAIDDALQLAAQLMSGSASVAAAGAWAALESLLVSGADNGNRETGRAVAADRAASLVAAGWPRAELTRLSHKVEQSGSCPSRLKMALESAGDDNSRRSAALLEWLQAGNPVTLTAPRDEAALQRVQALIQSPKQVLGRVRGYMTGSFRRLYRQRNLVLHGGHVRPVSLDAAIRTSGPLIGAALDRVSHAFELHGAEPLDGVARAECALRAVGDQSSWPLHELAIA